MKKLLFIFILLFVVTLKVSAQGEEKIRVGLTTFYEDVDYVNINNTSLNVGYYDDGFLNVLELSSSSKAYDIRLFTDSIYVSNEVCPEDYSLPVGAFFVVKNGGLYVGSYSNLSDEKLTFSKQKSKNSLKIKYDGKMVVVDNNDKQAVYSTYDTVSGANVLYVGKRGYRGYIEVGNYGTSKLTAVNIVDMNDYLYAVVCSEIYPSWHADAIKAQVLAARSFAYYYVTREHKYKNKPYDLTDNTDSQVYKGFNYEDSRVIKYVDETGNQMIYYDGKVIPAFFFAGSGGATESIENVWSVKIPYLVSVPDLYENEPEKKPWVKKYTKYEIKQKLANRGMGVGEVYAIEVTGKTESGRVSSLTIKGSAGQVVLKKEKIRYVLGLNSRKFELITASNCLDKTVAVVSADGTTTTTSYNAAYVLSAEGAKQVSSGKEQVIVATSKNLENTPLIGCGVGEFIFAGTGWGHGVGMSQAGAKGMAENGFAYTEIVKHYYTGVEVY